LEVVDRVAILHAKIGNHGGSYVAPEVEIAFIPPTVDDA
jgi:hypothetical protein